MTPMIITSLYKIANHVVISRDNLTDESLSFLITCCIYSAVIAINVVSSAR